MHHNLHGLYTTEIAQFNQISVKYGSIQPGFSISIKTAWHSPFGLDEDTLLIGKTSWPDLQFPSPERWAHLRLACLRGILDQPEFNPEHLDEVLSDARALFDSPSPAPISLLHAALETQYVCFSEPFVLLAAFSVPDSFPIIRDWYHGAAVVLPFDPNLHHLCQTIRDTSGSNTDFILMNRGLLIGSNDIQSFESKLALLSRIASQKILAADDSAPPNELQSSDVLFLPQVRSDLCAKRGRPLVLHLDDSSEIRKFIDSPACSQVIKAGLPLPGFSAITGNPFGDSDNEQDDSNIPQESKAGTSILIKPGIGVVSAADSIEEAAGCCAVFHTAARALNAAGKMGGIQLLDLAELQAAEKWESVNRPEQRPFSGEVALVTGAASGIGKAVVESLLQRGSAVVGLDINPSIETTFDHACYQGLKCDVFDESAVCETMRLVGRRFGGLDILVLNAGLFPGGCNIEKLTLTEFTRVLNINFVSNMVILRETFPMLRLAPRYGRVVIVGSKNMRAPGPGAAAYSTSKAALTQLARVAALEWGSEGIRVNVIHPDSVFDTALYTEEVLQARARHYGMTVEQYKKRNLLKTEITSHDVAELTAEMCGPLFRHMTGGQIQFDGGNDRTI